MFCVRYTKCVEIVSIKFLIGRIRFQLAIAIALSISCSKPSETRAEGPLSTAVVSPPPPVEAKSKYTMTERQKVVLLSLLEMEMAGWATAKVDTIFNEEWFEKTFLEASKLSAAYEENEIAADFKWQDKRVQVRGKIADISKDIAGNPSLQFSGQNPLSRVLALFPKEATSDLIPLKRGRGAAVSCIGAGKTLHAAVLRDCRILDGDGLAFEAARFAKRLEQALSGQGTPNKGEAWMVIFALSVERHLAKDNVSCNSTATRPQCKAHLEKVGEDPKTAKEWSTEVGVSINELGEAGLEWAKLAKERIASKDER